MSASPDPFEHAWRYFTLHAQQRVALFNFFVVLEGLLLAGWASAMTGDTPRPAAAAIMGILLTFFSVIFWKFDQRNSYFTKRAEAALATLENGMPDKAKLFTAEQTHSSQPKAGVPFVRHWTHGESLRVLFILSGIAGLIASGYAIIMNR